VDQPNYTYLVGTTADADKALATAKDINELLRKYKGNIQANVLQPRGRIDYYVAIGGLTSPEAATNYADAAKEAAIHGLAGAASADAKAAATLMLKGQVVDARAMFTSAR
jgi:hypothetical protein